ncbi:MAG: nucleotidyl transferase AbiEii/AbiGii toxin family protein [Candidatus Saganbacteria bacterium]|nr:nucleotidyl transferase AbiEii/AbiGii toxin family protein [Candidatus Saganbacteria bacterium]
MSLEQIKILVELYRNKGLRDDYIVNILKEYLQLRVLSFVYNSKDFNQKLIFTGGTCLRFCFNLPRLSEDLDFDYEGKLNIKKLADETVHYLTVNQKIPNVTYTLKGKNNKIYIKFSMLDQLGLSYENSKVLFVKVEPTPCPQAPQKTEVSAISKDGLYFYIKRYSLSDLMSGKIHAFLTRSFYKGKENEVDFKGRDAFDLIWYMGQGVVPNLKRLDKLLEGTKYSKLKWLALLEEIGEKLKGLKKQHLVLDLKQFIEEYSLLEQFLSNYLQVFEQYVEKQRA